MKAKKSGVIGIVGGMGPQAGVALHEAIIRNTAVEKDQDHLSVVLMTYPGEITDRTAYLEGKTLINPAFSILNIIEKMASLGVGVIGFPCNTSHAPPIFEPIQNRVRERHKELELVHLPSEVIAHIQQSLPHCKRVGVMATNGTYKSGIYQNLLRSHGFEVVAPEPGFQDQVIHKMIYDPEMGIKSNSVDISVEAITLWQQALLYFEDHGADALVLGCTELSLIKDHGSTASISLIDSTEILAHALIRVAKQQIALRTN